MSALSQRPLLAFGLAIAIGVAVWAAATLLIEPDPTFVSGRRCPHDSGFTCLVLNVPRDHLDPTSGSWEVTFAVQGASQERKGTLVVATGGPGSSGVAVADLYASYFNVRVLEDYELVFFDQRGIGQSQPLQCPRASLAWYSTPEMPTGSEEDQAAFREATEQYVADCVDEAGVDPEDLRLYSTAQAIEDLEVFRRWHGVDKLVLYGESYGTQYVQAYAAAYPEHVQALIIDGPVDMTRQGTEFYSEVAVTDNQVLVDILAACDDDPACSADFDGERALEVYDRLASDLRQAPMPYDFVTADGEVEAREFGLNDLETAVGYVLTPQTDRMFLQRALAQAARGELYPLSRLLYAALGQDPETLKAVPDPTWSDALYYAVDCADYAYGSGSAGARADRYFAAGEDAQVDQLRLGSGFFIDFPCAYWPSHGPEARPPYLGDTDFPIFVLGATWDPNTPYPNAERLAANLSSSYSITQPGGPHVIFLRGEHCPDDQITAYLLDGTLPTQRYQECPFGGVDPYVPIPAPSADDYGSTLEALSAFDDEISNNPDWWYWDAEAPMTFGCMFGGHLTYLVVGAEYEVEIDRCAISEGLVLTGGAVIHEDFTVDLEVRTAGGSPLTYAREENGDRTATGTLDP